MKSICHYIYISLLCTLSVVSSCSKDSEQTPTTLPKYGYPIGSPEGIILDKTGNIYISNYWSNDVVKISAGNRFSFYAGNDSAGAFCDGNGGPATAAHLHYPSGLAIDVQGNIYVGDPGCCEVRKINAVTGIITIVAGNGNYGAVFQGGPATSGSLGIRDNGGSIAVDTAGNIYIGDNGNNYVWKVFAGTGLIYPAAGCGYSGSNVGQCSALNAYINPLAICLDKYGNIYISDGFNYSIRQVNTSGLVYLVAGGNGIRTYSGDGGQATAAGLDPRGLTVDSVGNVYVADFGNGRVRKINAGRGIITTVAGNGNLARDDYGDGGQATNAIISSPTAVVLDGSGNLLITAYYVPNIRKVNLATGIITTAAH
jgi:hypothetical protein